MDCSHILYANDTLHHVNNALILANGCVTTVGLLPIEVENWEIVQERAIDPFVEFRSSELNKIAYSIIGTDNTRVSGLNIFMPELEGNLAYVILSRGTVIKDTVLIRFLYDMKFLLGEWPLTGQHYIVIEYTYEVKIPPNIAQIKIVRPDDYDPVTQMILYIITYNGSNWPNDVIVEDATQLTNGVIVDPEKFVINASTNSHTGNQNPIEIIGPVSHPIRFIIGSEYTLTLSHESISAESHRISNLAQPVDDNDAIRKIDLDNEHAQLVAHENDTSNPHHVTLEQARIENNEMSGPLVVHGDIDIDNHLIHNIITPVNSTDAANKQYVDDVSNDLHTNYYNKTDSDNRFVNITGDSMTGSLLINSSNPLSLTSPADPTIRLTDAGAGSNERNSLIRWSSDSFTFETANDDWSSKATLFKIDNDGKIQTYNYIRGASTNHTLRLQSDHGWVDIGAQDSNYLHFYTDRSKYYFDKDIEVDGIIKVYNHDSYLAANHAHIDGVNLYTGGTNPSSTTRFNIDAYLYATKVFQAVYNDYAEAFDNNKYIYEHIMCMIVELDTAGKIKLASENSNKVIGVVSNSFAMLINGTQNEIYTSKKIPIAMSGTVFVKPFDRDLISESDIGKLVVSAGHGLAKTITTDEYKYGQINYIGCVVGKVIGVDKNRKLYKILVMNM